MMMFTIQGDCSIPNKATEAFIQGDSGLIKSTLPLSSFCIVLSLLDVCHAVGTRLSESFLSIRLSFKYSLILMMAFILATDFDFIAYMSKMAFFWKLFSRQWRFWNMISMIFVVLHDILHYCNLPYERSETESSRFENTVTSSHTSECRLVVRSATRRVDLEICFSHLEICFSQLYPNGNKLCCFRYQLL